MMRLKWCQSHLLGGDELGEAGTDEVPAGPTLTCWVERVSGRMIEG
jgi:hypothetical protein